MRRWGIVLLAASTSIGCYEEVSGGRSDAAAYDARDVQTVDLGSDAGGVAEAGRDAGGEVRADVVNDVANSDIADVVATDVSDVSDVSALTDAPTDLGSPPCPSGQTRCDGACVDTASSVAHCGGCGVACSPRANASVTCAAGACRAVCDAGFADCDNDASNGCEASLDAVNSCGACGTRCQEPTPFCAESSGSYACVSGCSGVARTRCDMRCVDTATDAQHCGACDRACAGTANGRGVCVGGSCGVSCFTGFADCDGDASNGCEVETRSNTAHCGACGRRCAVPPRGSATCSGGACGVACDTGFANCDGDASNGCEADLAADASCGACGTRCASTSRCVRGVCAPCSALAPMVGGRAEVADAVPLRLASGSFTIEAWLFANGYANRCQNAIATKRGSGSADGWFFSVTGTDCGVPVGRLYYQVSGGVDPSLVANVAAPVGRWFHAAATYDAGTRVLTLWQDGAAVGSATLPAPRAATEAPMYIGNDSDGQAYTWNGYIDELRISSDVRYRAAFTAPPQLDRDAPVIALWRFQESTGVAVDASPTGYVARLVMAERAVSSAVCRP